MCDHHLEVGLIRGIESLILSNEQSNYVIALGVGSIPFGSLAFFKGSD